MQLQLLSVYLLQLSDYVLCAIGRVVVNNHHLHLYVMLLCRLEEKVRYYGQVFALLVGWHEH